MQRYFLEFILHIHNVSVQTLKGSLSEFGEALEITDLCKDEDSVKGRDFKINICTDEPTAIFDICSQFGRIRSIKIDEERS